MRVAMYARVSTQRQAQTQTIDQQLQQLQCYCQTHGWECKAEQIFRDDGYSGASLSRPGLDRLRDQLKQALFDLVVITAPDRLARKYVHQMLLVEEIERAGARIEFVDQPMSHNPHDQLVLQIRGAVAEYERSLIAERMRRGRQQRYQSGHLLPWTCPPYGYQLDPVHPRDPALVRLEPDQAATVANLFAWYTQPRQSLLGLAKRLIQLQIPTPRGRARWNQATIHGILTNPSYTGTVYLNRSRSHPASHRHSALAPIGKSSGHRLTQPEEWIAICEVPAIISQEQFEVVQQKLAHNQRYASRNNTAHQYLLRGLVSCGLCRLACCTRYQQGYKYYICRGRGDLVAACRDAKCSSRYIPAEQLDEVVWQDLRDLLTHPEMIAQEFTRLQSGSWLPQEVQARQENLRKAHVHLDHQIERLTAAYLGQVIELEEYKRRRYDLEQRQHALFTQACQLERTSHQSQDLRDQLQAVEAFCQRVQQGLEQATFEQKRLLVELLIDRVVVTEAVVEIRYVIPTTPQSERVRFCHLYLDYFDPTAHAIPDCCCLLWCQVGHNQPHFFIALIPASQQCPSQATLLPREAVHLAAPSTAYCGYRCRQTAKRSFIYWTEMALFVDTHEWMPAQRHDLRIQPRCIETTIAHHNDGPFSGHKALQVAEQAKPMRLPRAFFLCFYNFPGHRNSTTTIEHADAEHRKAFL